MRTAGADLATSFIESFACTRNEGDLLTPPWNGIIKGQRPLITFQQELRLLRFSQYKIKRHWYWLVINAINTDAAKSDSLSTISASDVLRRGTGKDCQIMIKTCWLQVNSLLCADRMRDGMPPVNMWR
ncbi:hypothetical protein ASPBRDRAFT_445365 [Aspergillus brasiliensis CBS 101740]|uniref:Uncharacterized protein n=1 Tax=Aspergillus brasiliensis (strain CBS 101740 / IMI 381727 / IBT 21946) TaxID=767769 RepID=A0A1L9URL8_ASPBC|nr:hypothetical protein ASPBRDRAFT_445365 [Aspergillus brasiliensis CBS 101740]